MELYYREKGSEPLPVLLLIHGLWGASENWLPVAEKLADRFHIYLPDLRNHGHSPHSARIDYECLTEDIHSLIETLHLPVPLFLAGHSMGGKIVLNFLLKYPRLVKKAVIIDIAPTSYPPSQEHLRILDFILKTNQTPYPQRKELTQHIFRNFSTEEDRQLLLKNIKKTAAGYEWKVNAPALQTHLSHLCGWPDSGTVSHHKILFIKGENSDYITGPEVLQAQFPQAVLKTISRAGHRIHCDQPGSLAEMIRNFLEN